MAKARTVYVCTNCGYTSAKWSGQCPSCKSWNTMEEREEVPEEKASASRGSYQASSLKGKLQRLSSVSVSDEDRLSSGIGELDRVLGGGIVRDSIIILAAKPGAGKSTLLLQTADNLARQGLCVLYVTGEESESQLRRRAQRIIPKLSENLWVHATSHFNEVLTAVDQIDPDVLFLDSIQTFYLDEFSSRPGSPTQVMECTGAVMRLAKDPSRPRAVLMAGQLTKEDELAGVRSLEHMVDTVLFMEADSQEEIRTLSATKNRFGSTGEMGFFTMEEDGLKEIANPSRFFITQRAGSSGVCGSSLGVIREGTRAMLVEVESLISQSYTPYPSRISECLSRDQMGTLLSILEQRGYIGLYDKNVVIKSTGGLRLNQPSVSLCVLMSLSSSALSAAIPPDTVFIGDVGLTGELKKVPALDSMVRETARMGFGRVYLPANALRPDTVRYVKKEHPDTRLIEKQQLKEVIRDVFGDYRRDLIERQG